MSVETTDFSTPIIDESFRQYVEILLQHHRHLSLGQDKRDETESIEDQLSVLWQNLDETQRNGLSGLGSDLNWVRRQGTPAPCGRMPEHVEAEDTRALIEAQKHQDWHALLHYLRICATQIPAGKLAYLRASAWSSLGFPKVASVFYDFAAQLEPSNTSIAVLALKASEEASHECGLSRAAEILRHPLAHPTVVVILAISMTVREAERASRSLDRHDLANQLETYVDLLPLDQASAAERVMSYQLAATCLELLDFLPRALACYEMALKLAPDNEIILVRKGLLLYGGQTDEAVAAFRRAADLESPEFWPYFFLAHHDLTNSQFNGCLNFCSRAAARVNSKPVRAELLEWSAISMAMLSFPFEVVKSVFREAIALDPVNKRINRNMQSFEQSHTETPTPRWSWDIEPGEELRVVAHEASIQLAAAP